MPSGPTLLNQPLLLTVVGFISYSLLALPLATLRCVQRLSARQNCQVHGCNILTYKLVNDQGMLHCLGSLASMIHR